MVIDHKKAFSKKDSTIDDVLVPTPIATYYNKKTKKYVKFIGASHIGSKRYFMDINTLSCDTDAFLYELIRSQDGENTPEYYKLFAEKMTQIVSDDFNTNAKKYVDTTPEDREIMIQTDGVLPYDEVPEHWHLADISEEKSKEILASYIDQPPPEGIPEQKKLEMAIDLFSRFMVELDNEREKKLMSVFDQVSSDENINNITIYYGKLHQPSIENKLRERGYEKIKDEQLNPANSLIRDVLKPHSEEIEDYVIAHLD